MDYCKFPVVSVSTAIKTSNGSLLVPVRQREKMSKPCKRLSSTLGKTGELARALSLHKRQNNITLHSHTVLHVTSVALNRI